DSLSTNAARRAKVSVIRGDARRSCTSTDGTCGASSSSFEKLLMDYKRLLTQVEKTLETIETEDTQWTVAMIAETIAANFRDDLGITGGRIYESRGDDSFVIVGKFGEANETAMGMVVPREYKPIELVLENGIVVMDPSDPAIDPVLEEKLGARRFAAIAAGDHEYIVSFDVAPELGREDILFSLN